MLRFYTGLLKTLRTILWIYLIFNLFWGLNYNRLGIAYQLKLHPAVYTTPELKSLTDSLIIRLNNAKTETSMGVSPKPPYTVIFAKAVSAYRIAAKNYPYLSYRNPSIKASLFGKLGDYLGFLGYYNPFTGESQVNVTIPSFLLPYTTCHEIAHQLGYATEDAANFVGYLTALSTPDPAFHYSAYFDLFNYANTELFYRDSAAARANFYKLNSLVRKDERTYRDFFRSYQNPAEPFITDLYSRYLKENNQPEGIETYSRVTAWLIAFQKKFHRL